MPFSFMFDVLGNRGESSTTVSARGKLSREMCRVGGIPRHWHGIVHAAPGTPW